ncbi:MAG: hypothetical protein ACE37M_02505 [Henriciella sp.]
MNFKITQFLLLSFFACGCSASESPTRESKSGAVSPTGYVDLIPPTNYSPIRGVICESLNTVDGEGAGACFDLDGPSERWTREYISERAATDLVQNYEIMFDRETGIFQLKTRIACSLDDQECRSTENADYESGVLMEAHTAALFGFKPEY